MRYGISLLLLLFFMVSTAFASTGVQMSGIGVGSAAAPPPGGSSCTDGSNCHCDTVSGVLACEDWENASFYAIGSTNPWYKAPSGQSGYRGGDSLWTNTYGAGGAGNWSNGGQPTTPFYGFACSVGVGQSCATREYCSTAQGEGVDDCWGPNSNAGAVIDIQRTGDYDAEIGALTLSGGQGASADVGAGNTHLAYRVAAGNTAGIVGAKSWTQTNNFGMTQLMAYSSNLASISLADEPWKHDEFGGDGVNGGFIENFGVGNTGASDGLTATFPFNPIMFGDLDVPPGQTPCRNEGYTEVACESALALASKNVGNFNCNSAALELGASTSQYVQSTDWPLGTWGCVRAHVTGMGTSDMEYKVWFKATPASEEVLVIHLDNFDAVSADICNWGYRSVALNPYANSNQGGGSPSTQTGYRYQDNMTYTNGTPKTCAEIGF